MLHHVTVANIMRLWKRNFFSNYYTFSISHFHFSYIHKHFFLLQSTAPYNAILKLSPSSHSTRKQGNFQTQVINGPLNVSPTTNRFVLFNNSQYVLNYFCFKLLSPKIPYHHNPNQVILKFW